MREILMCTGGVSQSACYERIQTAEMKLPTKICRPHKFVECTKIYKYPVGHLLTRLAATFANLVVTSTYVPSEVHVPLWLGLFPDFILVCRLL